MRDPAVTLILFWEYCDVVIKARIAEPPTRPEPPKTKIDVGLAEIIEIHAKIATKMNKNDKVSVNFVESVTFISSVDPRVVNLYDIPPTLIRCIYWFIYYLLKDISKSLLPLSRFTPNYSVLLLISPGISLREFIYKGYKPTVLLLHQYYIMVERLMLCFLKEGIDVDWKSCVRILSMRVVLHTLICCFRNIICVLQCSLPLYHTSSYISTYYREKKSEEVRSELIELK